MKNQAYRCFPMGILVFALLVMISPGLAADERGRSAAFLDTEATAEAEPPRSDLVPQWARTIMKAGACHSTTPCGSQFGSCAGWSGYTDCDDPVCGIYRWCGDCGDPFGCWDLATRQRQERFRVCFDSLGNSCTEWQNQLVLTACGCP